MIAHIPQLALVAALRAAGKIVPAKPSLPILTNALISTGDNCVKICATDLDQYLELTIEARIETAGQCCVPLKSLLETIAEIPGGNVCLKQTANWHLEIRSEMVGFSGRIAVIDSSEYPGAPVGDTEASIDIPLADLRALNNQVAFAVSTDQTRLALNGICLRKVNKHIEAVATDGHRLARLNLPTTIATDGHRLARLNLPTTIATEGDRWIVPPDATRMAQDLSAESETTIRLFLIPSAAYFEIPAASPFLAAKIWTKLIEGPYPAFQQVIPKATAWSAIFAREDLIRTVKRIRAVAKTTTDCPTINFDQLNHGNVVRLSGSSLSRGSEGREDIPATISGTMPPIAWNGNFLVEILGMINAPNITIRGNASAQAAIIEPTGENPSLMTILMPVRRHDT